MIIIGFGTVGRAFAELVWKSSDWLRKQHGITPQIVAIADRGGAMIAQDGIDLEEALWPASRVTRLRITKRWDEGTLTRCR